MPDLSAKKALVCGRGTGNVGRRDGTYLFCLVVVMMERKGCGGPIANIYGAGQPAAGLYQGEEERARPFSGI